MLARVTSYQIKDMEVQFFCPVLRRIFMRQHVKILCRYCGKDDLVKNGRGENGTRRYRRNHRKRSFQTEYSYNAWQPCVRERIGTQTPDSSGVGDIGRNPEFPKTR